MKYKYYVFKCTSGRISEITHLMILLKIQNIFNAIKLVFFFFTKGDWLKENTAAVNEITNIK